MRSDIVNIDNFGKGFQDAVEQTKRVAAYNQIGELESIQLQVLTEEMLSLARSITGEMKASFWIEMEDGLAELHMTTNAVLDREQRAELIASSTSRKNEAARGFLGRLKDMFEEAMAADPEFYEPTEDILADVANSNYQEQDWDGYERSILRELADSVKISIHDNIVDITVTKRFISQN